jgi:opacity protein-like surface antigen
LFLVPKFPVSFAIKSLFVLLVFTPVEAISQTSPQPRKDAFEPSLDLSLGVFGELTASRTPMTSDVETSGTFVTERTQSYSPSAGVLGTFHQSIHPWLGYNVNLGYTRFTQSYSNAEGSIRKDAFPTVGSTSYSQGSLDSSMYEFTLAYVAEGPRHKRLRTFVQLGGGGLFFRPANAPKDAIPQTRPTMVFGAGMEYRFHNHLGLRTEYRGLFYKGPDFAIDYGAFPKQRLFTITNTPSISLVYRFR